MQRLHADLCHLASVIDGGIYEGPLPMGALVWHQVGLRELGEWMLFGPPWIEAIGRERLLALPGYRTRAHGQGILASTNPGAANDAAFQARLREHLGKEWFDRGIFRRVRRHRAVDYGDALR